jgi:hypothetical protein
VQRTLWELDGCQTSVGRSATSACGGPGGQTGLGWRRALLSLLLR